MARTFSVTMTTASLTAAKDLIRITAPAATTAAGGGRGYTLRILKATVGTVSSETSDQVPIGMYYASTAGTGTATNVVGLDGYSTNQTWLDLGGVQPVVNLTVDATKAPAEPAVYRDTDVAFGFLWERSAIDFMDVAPGQHFVLRMDGALAGATAITARVVFEVI